MSLQKPPSEDKPSRVIWRLLVLVLLMSLAGVVVWATVTEQRVDLVENLGAENLELENPMEVGGVTLSLKETSGGVIPVVLLHEADIAGSVVWDSVLEGIGGRFKGVSIDLPGFGLSDRMPEEGPGHTVASMAEAIGSVVEERYGFPVVLVGAGLGGEVAAEIAVTQPDLVRGVVLVDVDFWAEDGWEEFIQRLPWVGRAATFTLRTGGRLSDDRWAPQCGEGGWCPTAEQTRVRELAATVRGTTDSYRSFLTTLPSSLVPSDLDLITAPVVYVWSTEGVVPADNVALVRQSLPGLIVTEVDVWKAHLEAPGAVLAAIETVGSQSG